MDAEKVEAVERNFATVGALYEDGVSLIFDGETEPTQKHYLCNSAVYFSPGDRVRIVSDSGTYIVEYVVGAPKQAQTVGIPSGGTPGQSLKKTSDTDYEADWGNIEISGTLPSGGTSGKVLSKKSSTNYDAEWRSAAEVPTGGLSGQVLAKTSALDGQYGWTTPLLLPSGGTSGQLLKKDSSTAGAASWATLYTLPTGGTSGQVLQKDSSTNGDVSWAAVSGILPASGSTGQFLVKSSYTNFAAGWETAYTLPTGGTTGQILVKNSSTAGDVKWDNVRLGNIINQYNTNAAYDIQFRTTSTYGTPVFQVRMGSSGTWYTITTA